MNLYKSGVFLLALFFIGCSPNSVYRGGMGAFVDYEDMGIYRRGSILDQEYESGYGGGYSGGLPSAVDTRGMRDSKAIQRATMRPYRIDGKWYYPQKVSLGERFDGIASWYGPDFHAKKTSNGEIYNMHAHTAASKILPMNTVVKVYNIENGKSTVVRINDRGPFVDGRIIDLSNAAAHKIEMVKKGTAKVVVEVIGFGGLIASKMSNEVPSEIKKEKDFDKEFSVGQTQESITGGDFYVQVGAFRRSEGAQEVSERFAKLKGYTTTIKEQEFDGMPIYRVLVEGFRSEREAEDFLARHTNIGGKVIVRE